MVKIRIMCPRCQRVRHEEKYEQSPSYYENGAPTWHLICPDCHINLLPPVVLGVEIGAVIQPSPVEELAELLEENITTPSEDDRG